MSDSLTCESRITNVVVYARGAVVTRTVELPVGLPSEAATLVVQGVTPAAEPGSFRTHIEGERRITGVQAPLVHPDDPPAPKPDAEEVKHLQRETRRVSVQRDRIQKRIQLIEGMDVEPRLQAPKKRRDVAIPGVSDRLGATLAVADIRNELLERLDVELRNLNDKLVELAEKLKQAQSPRRGQIAAPSSGPHRSVRVSLAAGSDHLRKLEISYSVRAARWWPAYSARLTDNGQHAEFSVEAFVAQSTEEVWRDATISLCTADMIQDVTLPELQSLRMGRRQPPARTGFREPPEGLDAMFAGYDNAFGGPPSLPYASAPEPAPPLGAAPMEDAGRGEYARAAGGAVAAPPQSAPMPRKAKKAGSSRRDKELEKSAMADLAMDDVAEGEELDEDFALIEAAGGAPGQEPASEGGISEQWLDFDALELAGTDDWSTRGQLRPSGPGEYPQIRYEVDRVEGADTPSGAADPLYARGMFDHRYDADGEVEIDSTGRPQRVRLLSKSAKSSMKFRCVPLSDERVFREVVIVNPLDAPLLPGPVDVFVDGALLITSSISGVDRGGTIRFGLGEEQRVRVARNVRAREETKGVFGGKTAMDHEVTFEIASSLPTNIELELIDRLPVSDDKDIDVELVSSEPKAEKYDQVERNARVRGGLRWSLPVKPGSKVEVNFTYRIGFDKDFELVGGNRRE